MTFNNHTREPSHSRDDNRRRRVVFCWSAISGYMAACWHALARRPEVDLHIIAHDSGDLNFQSKLLNGLSFQLLTPAEWHDASKVTGLLAERHPDVVAMTGWWLHAYRAQVTARDLRGCKFIMGVDSPWRHEGQLLTRLRYWQTLPRVDHFFVTGERSWQYVRRLGIDSSRISRGMYGVDTQALAKAADARNRVPWPRKFLFLGRYAPEKAIDLLVSAYAQYRNNTTDPWDLVCCGSGPLGRLLEGQPGIRDLGFKDPEHLGEIFHDAGAFVMPSRFDPWPLALVEAAAAGLPIVCTDACGSAVEIVRPLYNGLVVPSHSADAITRAMLDVTGRADDLPVWGGRSRELAAAYSSEIWADRWLDRIRSLS